MTRVRFAPSPTGELHIGGARSALYNYLFAVQNKGEFILRLEDTDQARYVEGSEKRLLADLKWLGLKWNEGPDIGGEYGPYVQSERLDIYAKHAQELIDSGRAYYCFCSEERLLELRKQNEDAKLPSKYDRLCLKLSADEIKEKMDKKIPSIIRLKIPEGSTSFEDTIHGKITIKNDTIDDQVLMKSDGFPTYHLANIVDDHLMKITHVIRGEEWLPSTVKHVVLYGAFGWNMPQWVHLPNVLNKNKAKLSKRKDGDVVWVSTYAKAGYLPKALVNFLALLGWHPQDNTELFSMDELVAQFSIDRVQKSGAVFDVQKLDWFNTEYIKKLLPTELDALLKPFYLTDQDDTLKLSTILQSRIIKLSDATINSTFYFTDKLKYDAYLLIPKTGNLDTTNSALEVGESTLGEVKDWTIENLKEQLFALTESQFSKQDLLWPIRVALTGEAKSPDVFDVLWALGREKSIERIKLARSLL